MDGMIDPALDWRDVGAVSEIPRQGARVVATAAGDVAVFRTHDDHVFALRDACPHRRGPLSQGLVHGHAVTCPLHGWVIELASGEARMPDVGCVPAIPAHVVDGRVRLAVAAEGGGDG